jgi:membrane protease YdiL (CAAX protease family)
MNDFESTPRDSEQNISIAQKDMGAPGPSHLGTWDSGVPTNEPAELFQSFSQPVAISSARIPHLGHLCLLLAFMLFGFVCMVVLMFTAMYFHLDGVTNPDQIKTNVHYLLGSEAVLYLVTLALSIPIFPLLWNKSYFAGIHWRGATALQLGWRLPAIALGCFALAALDQWLLPGPEHAPIEDIFRTPGAAWLMFGFGVTFAPFFEETVFRGFMLPALATAWDWAIEKSTGKPARPLDADGHPQWSIFAMVIASIVTSLPFALMHGEQTGYSLGPFLQVFAVSLVLCAVRLVTRSLAASTLVHACYNFLIFITMLVGTGGFKHLDKL